MRVRMEKHHRVRPRRALPSDSGELLNKLLRACKAELQMGWGWGGCSRPHAWGCPTCRGDRGGQGWLGKGCGQQGAEEQGGRDLGLCGQPPSFTRSQTAMGQSFLSRLAQHRAWGEPGASPGTVSTCFEAAVGVCEGAELLSPHRHRRSSRTGAPWHPASLPGASQLAFLSPF